MMPMFRLLTAEELAREFPRQLVPILAVVAEQNPEGEVYSDTCFTLFQDGHIHTPDAELTLEAFLEIFELFKKAHQQAVEAEAS